MCIVEHLTRLGDLLYTWLHPLDIDSRETKLCEGSRVMMMMIHLLPYVVISKTGLLLLCLIKLRAQSRERGKVSIWIINKPATRRLRLHISLIRLYGNIAAERLPNVLFSQKFRPFLSLSVVLLEMPTYWSTYLFLDKIIKLKSYVAGANRCRWCSFP